MKMLNITSLTAVNMESVDFIEREPGGNAKVHIGTSVLLSEIPFDAIKMLMMQETKQETPVPVKEVNSFGTDQAF